MEVTEVTVKLAPGGGNGTRCLAYASFVLDREFAIRDAKIVDIDGKLVVAMPSRKICDRCPTCGHKNILVARFCGHCGTRLAKDRTFVDADGKPKLYADVAHPITTGGRALISEAVIEAYLDELDRAGAVAPGGRALAS